MKIFCQSLKILVGDVKMSVYKGFFLWRYLIWNSQLYIEHVTTENPQANQRLLDLSLAHYLKFLVLND
jgi:hypothetical protein